MNEGESLRADTRKHKGMEVLFSFSAYAKGAKERDMENVVYCLMLFCCTNERFLEMLHAKD
jgi:hypothetical protein